MHIPRPRLFPRFGSGDGIWRIAQPQDCSGGRGYGRVYITPATRYTTTHCRPTQRWPCSTRPSSHPDCFPAPTTTTSTKTSAPAAARCPPTPPPPPSPTSTSEYYSGMQPRRDPTQLRSFLSLDLAESHAASAYSYPLSPSLLLAPPPPPVLSLRRSRDSLRSIPSPKPVPSASLPAIPHAHHTHTRSAPTSPMHAPPQLPPIAPSARLSLASFRLPWHTSKSPVSAAPASKRASIPATIARTISIASTTRRARRADALASLEGRARPKTAPSTSTRAPHRMEAHTRSSRNFMDMSDEEDGWGAADPAPLPLPSPPVLHLRSSPPPPSPPARPRRRTHTPPNRRRIRARPSPRPRSTSPPRPPPRIPTAIRTRTSRPSRTRSRSRSRSGAARSASRSPRRSRPLSTSRTTTRAGAGTGGTLCRSRARDNND
ncbi:hypothetical protein FIBSPDRAFT_110878 [Athelia psychrophila]|uniref:Uncharacterized protein n=1 Tax=Athelia psychrophila TaxID=1759441 RepID=A0A166TEL6_9AGAM|nr:hypothetical protein FIBSPDRAFT_110878 [Fibularhizoctonia sp. CBS 109695]